MRITLCQSSNKCNWYENENRLETSLFTIKNSFLLCKRSVQNVTTECFKGYVFYNFNKKFERIVLIYSFWPPSVRFDSRSQWLSVSHCNVVLLGVSVTVNPTFPMVVYYNPMYMDQLKESIRKMRSNREVCGFIEMIFTRTNPVHDSIRTSTCK